jgi:hypothetical protein
VQIISPGLRRCSGSADLRRALQKICKNFWDFRGVSQIFAVKLNANFGICRDLSRRGSVRPSKREDWVRVPCCAGKPHLILSEMFGAISIWHTYCHGNPNTEFVFTKRAAEELFRAVMPFGTHVMSTKENKRYKQLADESSEINPDMPAEQMKAIRLTIEQTKSMVNSIGEFAAGNVERVEGIQRSVKEIHDGEKIPIPMPEKLSGEDSSLDIRMRLKQIERYLTAKRKEPSAWGGLAFAFVEKSAEAVWNTELTELESLGEKVTWNHFSETMISYFGTQLPAREAQVRYKACRQETTVANFVRRLKACVQMLETTPLKPSMGDVISHFVDNLATGPRDWVLQQAPATWYTSVREVYMKALQWETNNAHRVESHKAEPNQKPQSKKGPVTKFRLLLYTLPDSISSAENSSQPPEALVPLWGNFSRHCSAYSCNRQRVYLSVVTPLLCHNNRVAHQFIWQILVRNSKNRRSTHCIFQCGK